MLLGIKYFNFVVVSNTKMTEPQTLKTGAPQHLLNFRSSIGWRF